MARIPLTDLTSDQLDALHAELDVLREEVAAYRNAPVLRHCLMPGCLREFDVAAWMDSRRPLARPSRSGEGWRQMRPTMATGYICPDHAPLVDEHRPRWDLDRPESDGPLLRCACGWESPPARWPAFAVAGWQDHLIPFAEPAADTQPEIAPPRAHRRSQTAEPASRVPGSQPAPQRLS